MRVKIFLISVFMLISVSGAMAYDWTAAGFQVLETGVVEQENYVILRDSNANVMKVRYAGELNEAWIPHIVTINNRMRTGSYIKVDTIEFFGHGQILEILVLPSSLTYKGTDYLPNIPAGITFIYDFELGGEYSEARYNFRVVKGEFFLRLNDKLINEVALCDRIKEAVDDPVSYLKKREPEYFLRKLSELENAQERSQKESRERYDRLVNAVLYYQNSGFLGFGNTPVKPQVLKRVIELKSADPKLKKDKIKLQLDSEKIEAKEKEIELILNVFYNEFE